MIDNGKDLLAKIREYGNRAYLRTTRVGGEKHTSKGKPVHYLSRRFDGPWDDTTQIGAQAFSDLQARSREELDVVVGKQDTNDPEIKLITIQGRRVPGVRVKEKKRK